MDKGVGVSLINSVPEELLFASASGIRIEYNMTTVHQCISVTIQYIQVSPYNSDNIHVHVFRSVSTGNILHSMLNCMLYNGTSSKVANLFVPCKETVLLSEFEMYMYFSGS